MRVKLILGTLAAGAIACIGVATSNIKTSVASPSRSLRGPTREELLARSRLFRQILNDIQAANFQSARAAAQGLIDAPLVPDEVVQGHRFIAMIARGKGNYAEAESSLQTALATVTSNPAMVAQRPWLPASIVMDQADLAAFGQRNRERAITLYDQVLAQSAIAQPRDVWIAAQNAAMMCADLGRWAEAVRRVDSLLASSAAGQVPPSKLIALRVSQANWIARSGDLPGAMRRSKSLWDQYQSDDDYAVFLVGLRVAEWSPATQDCATRLAITSALLSKINALRSTPSTNPAAPTAAQLDDLEHQTLVVMANSIGCDPGLVAWARAALGLPPQP
jgi:hypothetical protein